MLPSAFATRMSAQNCLRLTGRGLDGPKRGRHSSRPFVRHHAGLLDHLVMLDHNSSDNTLPFSKPCRRRGCRSLVLHDESLSFQQGPRLTDLARRCFAQVGADFVFPLDGDEFLRAGSRAALERVAKSARWRLRQVRWQTYVASDLDDATRSQSGAPNAPSRGRGAKRRRQGGAYPPVACGCAVATGSRQSHGD